MPIPPTEVITSGMTGRCLTGDVDDDMDDDSILIPGQIVFFLQVTEEMIGIDVGGQMIIPSKGLFAFSLSHLRISCVILENDQS